MKEQRSSLINDLQKLPTSYWRYDDYLSLLKEFTALLKRSPARTLEEKLCVIKKAREIEADFLTRSSADINKWNLDQIKKIGLPSKILHSIGGALGVGIAADGIISFAFASTIPDIIALSAIATAAVAGGIVGYKISDEHEVNVWLARKQQAKNKSVTGERILKQIYSDIIKEAETSYEKRQAQKELAELKDTISKQKFDDSQTLLRGARTPEQSNQILLRPAKGENKTDPKELLRAETANKENAQIEKNWVQKTTSEIEEKNSLGGGR